MSAASVQITQVKLEISCKALRDRDVVSKSDPCAVVFLEELRYVAPGGYPTAQAPDVYPRPPMQTNPHLSHALPPPSTYPHGAVPPSHVYPGGQPSPLGAYPGATAPPHDSFRSAPVSSPSGYPSASQGYGASPPSAAHHAPAASPNDVRHWREVGRTESIKDNLNPHFSVHVTVPYRFEEVQNVRIGIWDIDNASKELKAHDSLGELRTTVGDLVTGGAMEMPLSAPNKRDAKTLLGTKRRFGSITVVAHEARHGEKLLVRGHFSGKKLAKCDVFSSDPYLMFTQVALRGPQSRTQLRQTEVVRRNLNPVWSPVKFEATLPPGGTYDHVQLEVKCMDWDDRSKHDEIGTAKCTLSELLSTHRMPLVLDKKRGRRGELLVSDISVARIPSVINYLQGGLRLHFTVAVDLTASNGDPRDPTSLHYTAAGRSNQYLSALTAVGSVLGQYAPQDGLFTAYGFGAQLPNSFQTSFCFPLGLQHDPRCAGISGIVGAYQRAISSVRLSGPTNFTPVIEAATRAAVAGENSHARQNYHVLLILTDGDVTDFSRTVDRIIDVSASAPLSIIIVGVGNSGFGKMIAFDADSQKLTSSDGRRSAVRDIVQFVPMNDFAHQPHDRLAAAVLAELPTSIVEYYISRSPPLMPANRMHS